MNKMQSKKQDKNVRYQNAWKENEFFFLSFQLMERDYYEAEFTLSVSWSRTLTRTLLIFIEHFSVLNIRSIVITAVSIQSFMFSVSNANKKTAANSFHFQSSNAFNFTAKDKIKQFTTKWTFNSNNQNYIVGKNNFFFLFVFHLARYISVEITFRRIYCVASKNYLSMLEVKKN